jgi:hypothetical protein
MAGVQAVYPDVSDSPTNIADRALTQTEASLLILHHCAPLSGDEKDSAQRPAWQVRDWPRPCMGGTQSVTSDRRDARFLFGHRA